MVCAHHGLHLYEVSGAWNDISRRWSRAISKQQDRGYVQAVEKKHGGNPHCSIGSRSGRAARICRPCRHAADMGTSAGSTLSIGQRDANGTTFMCVATRQRAVNQRSAAGATINALGMRLVSHADSVKTPFHFLDQWRRNQRVRVLWRQ